MLPSGQFISFLHELRAVRGRNGGHMADDKPENKRIRCEYINLIYNFHLFPCLLLIDAFANESFLLNTWYVKSLKLKESFKGFLGVGVDKSTHATEGTFRLKIDHEGLLHSERIQSRHPQETLPATKTEFWKIL